MNYWQRRQQQLNQQLEKDEARLKKRLSSFYDTEFRKLDRQIAAYYKQYGTDHVIEYRQLLESLPAEDKRLLIEQMDVFAAKYPQYAHLMPVRESVYKLDRLEGLQYSVRLQQLEIGAATQKEIQEHLEKQALRGGNVAAQAMGFGENFYSTNPDIVKRFVGVAWSNGENFSQKIWKNTGKLAGYLNTDIAQGFARGDSYEKLVRNLRQRFGKVSRKDAYRLIYTEGTYVMAEATMQPFTEDFEEYRLSTAADGKVCDICRELAKKKFRIRDRQPGVNFPPLHPWCRCTFTIEVEDWDKWMEDYEQRHGNGQSGKVAKGLNDSGENAILGEANDKEKTDVHVVGKIDKNIYKCITKDIVTDEVIITDERIQHIKERHPNDYERYYGYLKEIVEHPQYIVETNRPYTALILKEFSEGEQQFKTVLRLTTSHDNPDFKNSIITFMKINEKEWKRMLKNKRILYKKE